MKDILKKNVKLIIINIIVIIISSVLSVLIALLIQIIIDTASEFNWEKLHIIMVYSILFLLFYFIFSFLRAYFTKKLLNKFIYDLRFVLFQRIFDRNMEDFRKYDTSNYLSVLTNDIQLFSESTLNSILQIAQNILAAVITLAVLFYVSPFIAFVVMVCIIIMYLVPFVIGKMIQCQQIILSKDLMNLMGVCKSFLNGFHVIFSYRIQGECIDKFNFKNKIATRSRMRMDGFISLSESLSAVLSVSTEFIVIYIAAWLVIKGDITIGTMVAIMQLSGTFIQPIMIIMQNIPRVIGGKSIIRRFQNIINFKPKGFIGSSKPTFNLGIELKNLSFSYHRNQDILYQINCYFEKNKKYALVGANGSGKSTLIGLLAGLSSTYEGSILIDGVELRSLNLSEVLSYITVTWQNSFLFDTNVQENITLGYDYDRRDLDEACRISGVNLFLEQLPDGLECVVIEGGNNLSGGQKQRISIARALLQKKPIMILDEGTAAIDKKTAYDIENSLLDIPDLTLIAVTHNLEVNLLMKYDSIVFLKNSQIAGMGNFKELYDNNDEFRDFLSIACDS